jgi:hypothetical protein
MRGQPFNMENMKCSNQPHGRRPPEKTGRAVHGGTTLKALIAKPAKAAKAPVKK